MHFITTITLLLFSLSSFSQDPQCRYKSYVDMFEFEVSTLGVIVENGTIYGKHLSTFHCQFLSIGLISNQGQFIKSHSVSDMNKKWLSLIDISNVAPEAKKFFNDHNTIMAKITNIENFNNKLIYSYDIAVINSLSKRNHNPKYKVLHMKSVYDYESEEMTNFYIDSHDKYNVIDVEFKIDFLPTRISKFVIKNLNGETVIDLDKIPVQIIK